MVCILHLDMFCLLLVYNACTVQCSDSLTAGSSTQYTAGQTSAPPPAGFRAEYMPGEKKEK